MSFLDGKSYWKLLHSLCSGNFPPFLMRSQGKQRKPFPLLSETVISSCYLSLVSYSGVRTSLWKRIVRILPNSSFLFEIVISFFKLSIQLYMLGWKSLEYALLLEFCQWVPSGHSLISFLSSIWRRNCGCCSQIRSTTMLAVFLSNVSLCVYPCHYSWYFCWFEFCLCL